MKKINTSIDINQSSDVNDGLFQSTNDVAVEQIPEVSYFDYFK